MSEQANTKEEDKPVQSMDVEKEVPTNSTSMEQGNDKDPTTKLEDIAEDRKSDNLKQEEGDGDAPPDMQQAEIQKEEATIATTKDAASAAEIAETAATTTTNKPTWDHSDRRVMLQGVHKFHDIKTARKLVDKIILDLNKEQSTTPVEIDKAKKPPKKSWMAITLKHVDMVQPFIDYINKNDFQSNGRRLFAKLADEVGQDSSGKRKHRDDDGDNNTRDRKRPHEIAAQVRRPVTLEEIKDKICPLWRLSAQEQSTRKIKDMIKKSSMKIIAEIKAKFRSLEKEQRRRIPFYDWIAGKRSINVKDVIPVPSPIRNKVEFTFGYRYLFDESSSASADDPSAAEPPKVPAVGFMILGWAGGVSRPHGCPIIGLEFCALSDLFDEFLKDCPVPPYDSISHTGFWRFLTIRASRRTRECMLVITHAPPSGGRGEAEAQCEVEWSSHVQKEKERLLEILKNAELPVPDQEPIQITSVYFQEFAGLSNPAPDVPVQLAYGKATMEERLGKCTFHISPGAFFQVNTPGAEILYQQVVEKVKEVSDNPRNTLLFDVCCGTGTIGLTCMKEGVVGKVVGIDISAPAIEDAKKNAEANGYTEASATRFVASRAEHVMGKEIAKAEKVPGVKFVAVVDPAREGLHTEVLRALKASEKIGRIVYVSCNPTGSLIKDAAILCSPPTKKYKGSPFRVESAQPVDMFPLTSHCEMVITFDRLRQEPKTKDDGDVVEQSGSMKQPDTSIASTEASSIAKDGVETLDDKAVEKGD